MSGVSRSFLDDDPLDSAAGFNKVVGLAGVDSAATPVLVLDGKLTASSSSSSLEMSITSSLLVGNFCTLAALLVPGGIS